MSEKKISKRLTFDRDTKKNYMVKQTQEDIPSSEELVKKVKYYLDKASSIIPKPLGSECIGFLCTFIYERSTNDKFDYQSASIVELEKVNEMASDMAFKDLRAKIMRSYGRQEDAVRQDASVINQE